MQYSAWSWYRRTFTVPASWSGQRVILHLDAVDWQSQVYVNGQSAGVHRGGYDPFSFTTCTPYLMGTGPQELIIQRVNNPVGQRRPAARQTNPLPRRHQCITLRLRHLATYLSSEPVDALGARNLVMVVLDIEDNGLMRLTVNTYSTGNVTVNATVLDDGVVVTAKTGPANTELDLPVPYPHLWAPDNPFLYNLESTLVHNGATNDSLGSYFAMRKISVVTVAGVPRIFLNNQPIFGIGPLDQGYWPDGIYTAPTDDALKFDLHEIKDLGYNSIRKHEKVERQRWYYWADTLGLMIWQDMPTCNSYTGNPNPPPVNPLQFIAELTALVTNHWNSPSIIMWDIFNEDQGEAGSGNGVGQTNTAYLVGLVKGLDPSRLVNQASGGAYFGVGDVLDNHSYPAPGDPTSSTQAVVDGEYGGIGLLVPGHLWNPSQAFIGDILATNSAAFGAIYDAYANDLLGYKPGGLSAAIETQITDVENECDGLLTYDRVVIKPNPARILSSNQKDISGQLSVTAVVPTSQSNPQTWRYTINPNTGSSN